MAAAAKSQQIDWLLRPLQVDVQREYYKEVLGVSAGHEPHHANTPAHADG